MKALSYKFNNLNSLNSEIRIGTVPEKLSNRKPSHYCEIRNAAYSRTQVARNGGTRDINNRNKVECNTGDSFPTAWILVSLLPFAQNITWVPPIFRFDSKQNHTVLRKGSAVENEEQKGENERKESEKRVVHN
ncbi:hypothetical protein SUGI_0530850 [Cryptomeria japonica]|nr:hypothetical protein SUGI_0530850 [Cryptomeria japonica]